MHIVNIKSRSPKWLGLTVVLALTAVFVILILIEGVRSVVQSTANISVEQTIVSNSLPLGSKWKFTTEDRILFPPVVREGIVFIRTTKSTLVMDSFSPSKVIALNANSGQKLWETVFKGLFRDVAPLVVGDVALVPVNGQKTLRAVNKLNGTIVWEKQGINPTDDIHGLAQDGAHVFVASGIEPVRVFALDAQSGQSVWEHSGDFPSRSLVDITFHNGKVYVLFTTKIFVLNADTGEMIQTIPINATSFDTPTYNGNFLYTNPETGIWAFNLNLAQVAWSYNPQCILRQDEGPLRLGRYFLFSPTPIGDGIYVTGGCSHVFALDAVSGNLRWTYDNNDEGTLSHVANIDNIGYAMFTDGTIRGLDLTTGKEMGRLITSPSNRAWEVGQQGVASWENNLYFTFGGKTIFAFGK